MPTTQQEKITSLFNKLSLEHKKELFEKIRDELTNELVKEADILEQKHNEILLYKDRINNGK